MPRYVILEHDHPLLHWDFMVEAGAVLRAWRLARPPAPGACIEAEALGDHRRAYLDYEGPVSGNRGRVLRWDHGDFALVEETENRLVLDLNGGRWSGRVVMERLPEGGPWRARFAPWSRLDADSWAGF